MTASRPVGERCTVTFAGRSVEVAAGTPLNRALLEAGLPVESPCGGRGRCGRCRVRLAGPALPAPSEADRRLLSAAELAEGYRLSCQHTVLPGMRVDLVAAGLAPGGFVDAARKAGLPSAHPAAFPLAPLVEKTFVTVSPPAHNDSRGDWERLVQALAAAPGPPGTPEQPEGTGEPPAAAPGLAVLQGLPAVLRQAGHRVTVLRAGGEVLAVEPGDTRGLLCGAAVDIGTSTLAVSLVDLTTGAEVAASSGPNPQAAFGADLMTRLGHAFRPEGRRELRERVAGTVNALLAEACRRGGIPVEAVYAASVVGNTAMHHLFLGLAVEQLGLAPYVPAVTGPLLLAAEEAALNINPRGVVYCLPCIGGFAGADIAAVLLATRLWESDEPVLVIDLGTNGEILLGDRTGVLVCSAPAGPAFEGGAVSRGMRAVAGAIQGVAIEEDVRLDVIGGVPPRGICGSGLVDAVAAMLRAGVLDPSGRLRPDRRGGLPDAVARRFDESGSSFILAWPEPGGVAEAVALTQKDVRQLQLAKGAIRAGVEVLLAERGLRPADLGAVLLAGTFGNYIKEESALAIGLLPPVPVERVRPIGNAAMAGARLALLSREARLTLERTVGRVRHVPLATRADFQEIFIAGTAFPEEGVSSWSQAAEERGFNQ